MANLRLTYGGHTLPSNLTQHLINEGIVHNVLPSLFICQLYYESNWGNSNVARQNNNWGGLTWTGNPNRPSGIVVSRGTARPSNEGGYYMRFKSVQDYLTDYVYLLTGQGIYKVANKPNFTETVKGLFRVGGASYDYAATGWQNYLNTMTSIRNGINSNNGNILNNIDNNPNDYGDGSTGGSPPCFPTSPESVVTSKWGWRMHPIEQVLKFHAGTDYASPNGGSQPIYATQSGTVIVNQWSDSGGWMVYIKHSGDPYYSRYLHLNSRSSVPVGSSVEKCQQIGMTGNTGASRGIHLHFEVALKQEYLGTTSSIDPEIYLEMTFGGGTGKDDSGNRLIELLLSDALNGWKY